MSGGGELPVVTVRSHLYNAPPGFDPCTNLEQTDNLTPAVSLGNLYSYFKPPFRLE